MKKCCLHLSSGKLAQRPEQVLTELAAIRLAKRRPVSICQASKDQEISREDVSTKNKHSSTEVLSHKDTQTRH